MLLDSRRLRLTRKEYELLLLMVENAGEVVPREVLLLRVWGYGSGIRTRTLDVHIRRLRRQLGSYGAPYIETIFHAKYNLFAFRIAPRDFLSAFRLVHIARLTADEGLVYFDFAREFVKQEATDFATDALQV